MGAFQFVVTITNRRQRFQRLTGLGVLFSLLQFEMHPYTSFLFHQKLLC